MENEMIERAAKAICVASGHPWEFAGSGYRETCVDFARAAVKAIREPTRDMTMAACDALPCVDGVFGHAGILSANVWRKMIDAALSPSPQPVRD